MPPPADALLGRVIAAKYRIDAFLGGGAMGAVYRARHIALERDVAIKVIRTALATDRSFVARFHREALSMSRMTHAHLIHVSDFGEEPDGLLYLVMEYVAGHTLEHVIREQAPLPKERVVHIMSQVLSAVAVAHDAGVIHRDLKPENILLLDGLDDEGNPSESVKVCDFGIASMMGASGDDARASVPPPGTPDLRDIEKTAPLPESLVGHLTQAGALVGTPAYMSPEQVQGFTLDARADLYALGVVMYEMLTGSAPFPAETLEQILAAHVRAVPRSPDRIVNCDRGLATITMRALAKNPRERFASARAMRAEVRATLMSLPIGSPSRAKMRVTHPSTPAPAWTAGSAPYGPTEPGGRQAVSLESLETLAQAGSLSKPGPASETSSTASPARLAYRRFGLLAAGVVTVLGATAAVWFGARVPSRSTTPVAQGATDRAPLAVVASTRSAQDDGTPVDIAPAAAPQPSQALANLPTQPEPADKSSGPNDKVRPAPWTASASGQAANLTREAIPSNGVAATTASAEPAPPPAPVAQTPPVASAAAAPGATTTPASAPPPQEAPVPAAAPFSPAAARVSASIANVQRTNRAAVAGLISHVDFTPCYRDMLRSLGRAEGGQGSLHLEIDEDGIIHAVRATLPGSLTGASACIAGKVRGQRVTPPDTGSASADVALVFTPQ